MGSPSVEGLFYPNWGIRKKADADSCEGGLKTCNAERNKIVVALWDQSDRRPWMLTTGGAGGGGGGGGGAGGTAGG